MIEVLRSNDPVRLSWAEAVLADAAIEVFLTDAHASVLEGSVTAIERRLLVLNEDAERAAAILKEADARGLGG